ncbi:cysteine proteinase [Polychaeton citri CBS 116435]|uniref:ubiquitinyl hydrolase 1 n=1 Tax=Polychaeton citri CBS 116435 TaxID=1314669 RepID=A0A9P4QAH3_9PEZI|nr:cysteine proteinase [Polychaeton citri CBS 116435]
MAGVHRFLSRREKKRDQSGPNHNHSKSDQRPVSRPDHFGNIFTLDAAPRKADKEHERKITGILERLRHYGIDNIVEANVEYALRSANGDSDGAFRLLMLLEDTYEGLLKPFTPRVKLLGAVNRDGVTCYLDALLFAMFARLDSFEAMLYDSFEDGKRRRLAGMMRLWVNMLRTGRLITTDITRNLQQALADCGWEAAGQRQQQDPSEAFTFITGQLELPLLTLKMDLYHTGKEDPQDDHKFVNERLLEVAIPEKPSGSTQPVTLEDCLEHYFNNRIEVKRHLENQRRNTLKSVQQLEDKVEKVAGVHVEVAEVADTPRSDSPMVESPIAEAMISDEPSLDSPKTTVEKLRPTAGRKRTESIFSQRRVELSREATSGSNDDPPPLLDVKGRKMSTRTEVLMPAWQFFKLLPWYTDNMPTSDAQVAAHFARTRPVLGICLKRYSFTLSGQATRLSDYIDIPLEIAVPNFVSDDNMNDEGPLVGNFRLLLQSVVCHRGSSVHSGHYITLCRGGPSSMQYAGSQPDSSDTDDELDPWMRFDDLAKTRISYVDIRQALKEETPYLLFYQVQPIGDDGHSIHDLPTYAEATSRSQSDVTPLEKPYLNGVTGSDTVLTETNSREASYPDATDWAPESDRPSFEMLGNTESRRGRASTDERRRSITFDEPIFPSNTSDAGGSMKTDTASVPATPSEEKPNGFLAVASKIGSKRAGRMSKGSTSRSRPTSTGPHCKDDGSNNRFSLNMAKLTQRMTKSDHNLNNLLPQTTHDSKLAASESQSAPASRQSEDDGSNIDQQQQQPQLPSHPPPPPPPPSSPPPPFLAEDIEQGSEADDKHTPLPASRQNPSKESITVSGKPSKRKDKEKYRLGGGSGSSKGKSGKTAEDRDCVVM